MNKNDPQWGGPRHGNGPPDLGEIIQKIRVYIRQYFGNKDPVPVYGKNKPFTIFSILLGILLLFWSLSGFFVVDERENAVITRFGRYINTIEQSGLHWRLPWPIESNQLVNMTEIRSLEVGTRGKINDESVMLTGDQNIIEIQLEVQYNIKSAKDFLFKNRITERDGKDIVKQAAEAAIREVVGRNKVDYVLNEGRGKIAEDTKEIIQELLDRYGVGILVARVNISDVQPPEQVQAAFGDAVKARQDRSRLVNEGTAYANDVIPKASGTAARLLQEAAGYRQQVVLRAQGDASRFKQVLSEYVKAPQVMRDRLYLDAMQQIYQNTTKLLVDQKSSGNLLYLPLDKLIQPHLSAHTAGIGSIKPNDEAEKQSASYLASSTSLNSNRNGR